MKHLRRRLSNATVAALLTGFLLAPSASAFDLRNSALIDSSGKTTQATIVYAVLRYEGEDSDSEGLITAVFPHKMGTDKDSNCKAIVGKIFHPNLRYVRVRSSLNTGLMCLDIPTMELVKNILQQTQDTIKKYDAQSTEIASLKAEIEKLKLRITEKNTPAKTPAKSK